jgi:hypothetical protein
MNEYTYQIWGKIFNLSFRGEVRPMSLISTEVVIAEDCVKAMEEAKKQAKASLMNYWEIRDFRKL